MPATPYFREAGHGPTVLCLHSNASHSGQWRGLMELLSDRFRVAAVDSYGAGKSPEWPSDREITLADEVDLIEPLLASAPEGVHLVGHSYGAAIALKAALMHPARVRSLALYEPTIFALVDRDSPRPNATEGIQRAVREGVACLERGDREGAARAFIDFWMGEGSFDRTPVERRGPIVEACRNAAVGLCADDRAGDAGGVSADKDAGALHGGRAVAGVVAQRGAEIGDVIA